jgi:hypothetical protein
MLAEDAQDAENIAAVAQRVSKNPLSSKLIAAFAELNANESAFTTVRPTPSTTTPGAVESQSDHS